MDDDFPVATQMKPASPSLFFYFLYPFLETMYSYEKVAVRCLKSLFMMMYYSELEI